MRPKMAHLWKVVKVINASYVPLARSPVLTKVVFFAQTWEKDVNTTKVKKNIWAVVVAQLIEGSFPITEVCGSNPVISKIYIEHFTVNCKEKTKIREKEAGNGLFRKNVLSGQPDPTSTEWSTFGPIIVRLLVWIRLQSFGCWNCRDKVNQMLVGWEWVIMGSCLFMSLGQVKLEKSRRRLNRKRSPNESKVLRWNYEDIKLEIELNET